MSLAIKILKDIISIPSQVGINPEKDVADYFIKLFNEKGFDVKVFEFAKNRPNIIARYKFSKPGPKVIFNGHMDTKPAENGEKNVKWKTNPFLPVVLDGKIFGLGACDMKGGIASAVSAILRCIDENSGSGEVVVNLVSDEESTSLYGTVPICENRLISGDIAIVMEPTECRVCKKQMGNMFFKSNIRGIGGHTGVPDGKVNPFNIASKYLNRLEEWILTKRVNKDDLQPFINVGRYEGGTSSGTIPSECTLFWGTRVMPNDSFFEYFREVRELTDEFNLELDIGCDVFTKLFEGGGIDSFSCESFLLEKLVEKTGAKEDMFCASSDAGFIYNMLNVNSCIFGPGSLKQAHLPNEFVEIEQVERCERIIYEFLKC